MRIANLLITAALLSGGCAPRDGAGSNLVGGEQPGDVEAAQEPSWTLRSGDDGAALALRSPTATVIDLFCPAGQNRLRVNVPAFKPIGSEERLSFGSGGEVVALVADPRGDAERGGVSGTGPVPDDLKGLVAGPIAASYGAQASGPHPAPPSDLSRPFVTACFEHATAALQAGSKPTPSTSPCLVQDGELLRISPLRAIGTEPFWGARIEGRCVTYSHPEDQKGTRIWTRFNTGPQGGVWIGTLAGKSFVLRTRPAVNCSDGMSDKRYQLSVDLVVNGEERRGCAEPMPK
jgi:uncharacterized membrane protein